MATITLAKFLQESGLLNRFRQEVLPDLVYLRSVLGDEFFQDLAPRGFRANPTGYSPGGDASRIYNTVTEGAAEILKDEDEATWLDASPNYRQKLEDDNLGHIRNHLLGIEKGLLGTSISSHPYYTGAGNTTCHGRQVCPVPRDGIVPITAMLGEGRVCHAIGGAVGGYSSAEEYPGYRTPVDGTPNRHLPLDALNRVLAELKNPEKNESPTEDHCIFAGACFSHNPYIPRKKGNPTPVASGGWNPSPAEFYDNDDHTLQPRIFFSPAMPDNAVYVIAPRKVFLSISPLCSITISKMGIRITALYSEVWHSLLHPQHGQDLERYHFAFLAVTAPPFLPPKVAEARRRQAAEAAGDDD